jgi:UDP-glucuronate 4-epimerase
MKILVTGSAGFIGSALVMRLLELGNQVIGIDNHNDYYDPVIKNDRLMRHLHHPDYVHLRLDIADQRAVEEAFSEYKPQRVVNLAAQAGVRYSIENPLAYVNANIVGFANILEGCRKCGVDHLVYASSSSVYGANSLFPFSVHHSVDHPLSVYAATKKSNELIAHSYSHIYGLPTTGLRFFTVYGPWGRPDMALFKFTKAMLSNEKIQVYNNGKHSRDFTYIDDIVEGVLRILPRPALPNLNWSGINPDPGSSKAPWRIYNIGSNRSIELTDFIKSLERALNIKAKLEFLPMQAGDLPCTYADVADLANEFDFIPKTSLDKGIDNFVLWYQDYFSSDRS